MLLLMGTELNGYFVPYRFDCGMGEVYHRLSETDEDGFMVSYARRRKRRLLTMRDAIVFEFVEGVVMWVSYLHQACPTSHCFHFIVNTAKPEQPYNTFSADHYLLYESD